MQYMRCECGKSEYWDGGSPPSDCQGCDHCNKTFARAASDHKVRAAHETEVRFDPRTGIPIRRVCTKCHTYLPLEDGDTLTEGVLP